MSTESSLAVAPHGNGEMLSPDGRVGALMSEICSGCNEPIEDYASPNHRCGHFVGWPNYRKAISERVDLKARFRHACENLRKRGLLHLLSELMRTAMRAKPAVAMPSSVCDDLLREGKYRSYGHRVELWERPPAAEVLHTDRTKVDQTIYPVYGRYLHYAALSPEG